LATRETKEWAELVGRPLPAEAGFLAEGLEAAPEAREGDGGGVAGAEHEAFVVVETEQFQLLPMPGEGGDR
jgi:hypothetical protein